LSGNEVWIGLATHSRVPVRILSCGGVNVGIYDRQVKKIVHLCLHFLKRLLILKKCVSGVENSSTIIFVQIIVKSIYIFRLYLVSYVS